MVRPVTSREDHARSMRHVDQDVGNARARSDRHVGDALCEEPDTEDASDHVGPGVRPVEAPDEPEHPARLDQTGRAHHQARRGRRSQRLTARAKAAAPATITAAPAYTTP